MKRVFLLLVLACLSSAYAVDINDSFGINPIDVFTNSDILPGFPLPTGARAGLQYKGLVPGLVLSFIPSAGYINSTLYRTDDGSPYQNLPQSLETRINTLHIGWELLFEHNVMNHFSYYIMYDGLFRKNYSIEGTTFEASPFPDKESLLHNTFSMGIVYDSLEQKGKTASGLKASLFSENGPSWFFNSLDYYRIGANMYASLPLYTYTSEGTAWLAISAVDYLAVDYLFGNDIPIYAFQSFGGLDKRSGLGKSVRGFEEASYDTNVKIVNNLDIRLFGPDLFIKDLYPVLVAFLDAGYYSNYSNAPPAADGFLLSAGMSFHLVLLNIVHLAPVISFPLAGRRVDGKPWNFGFALGFHF